MSGNSANALWITLIGMRLVFIAILALWGMMALIVRLTTEREESGEEEADSLEMAASEESAVSGMTSDNNRKRQAAAAAVAVALQLRRAVAPARAVETAGALSAWQAVHRASQISQRVRPQGKR
jgi:Na+-transporting methylmalonyl-CoA/oxaloacetate decarboxylase gamma subunit